MKRSCQSILLTRISQNVSVDVVLQVLILDRTTESREREMSRMSSEKMSSERMSSERMSSERMSSDDR
jgi:hypothetical protein